MYTHNEIMMKCSLETAFRYARQVEFWPELLPHYRSTVFHRGGSEHGGLVEMAAIRSFKPFNWPVWWVSEMEVRPEEMVIAYKHIRGVTKGMEVEWRLANEGDSVIVSITHQWDRPPIGRQLASNLIGEVFVHAIADQTLQGLKLQAEQEGEVSLYG